MVGTCRCWQVQAQRIAAALVDGVAEAEGVAAFVFDESVVALGVGVRSPSTARQHDNPADGGTVRVTHPFHPLFDLELEFVKRRRNWQADRVYVYDPDGALLSPVGDRSRDARAAVRRRWPQRWLRCHRGSRSRRLDWLPGLRDAVGDALGPVRFDADHDHRGDVGVRADPDERAEVQLQVRAEL